MSEPELTDDQKIIVRNAAMAILKNGASFLEWLKARRKGEAAYAFLFGGLGTDLFNWCLQYPDEASKLQAASKPHVIDTSLHSEQPRHQSRGRSSSRSISRARSYSSSSTDSRVSSSPSPRHRSRHRSRSRQSSRRYRSRSRSIQRRRSPPRYRSPYRQRRRSPVRSDSRERERADRAAWVQRRREERAPKTGQMYGWSPSSDDEINGSSVSARMAELKKRLLQKN